jgi:hypothetical protein
MPLKENDNGDFTISKGRPAWNAGRQVGAKRALKLRQIWAIRFFLDREGRMRDRALFDLAMTASWRMRLGEDQDRYARCGSGNPDSLDGGSVQDRQAGPDDSAYHG